MSIPNLPIFEYVELKNCHKAGYPPKTFSKGLTEYKVRLKNSGHWQRVYFDSETVPPNKTHGRGGWFFVKQANGSKVQVIFPEEFLLTTQIS